MSCSPRLSATLLCVPFLFACGGGGGGGASFQIQNTTRSVVSTAPLTVGGDWMVYLANENLSGEDLNGVGGITNIDVAVAIRFSDGMERVIGVTPLATAIVDGEVFLVVDESVDGVDRNGMNGATEILLLHWSDAPGLVTALDEITSQFDPLDPDDVPMMLLNGRIYYSAEASPAGADTTLRYIDPAVSLTPNVITNQAGTPLSPELIGESEGLIFLRLDESVEGVALNADGMADGDDVLALLDGTSTTAEVVSVGVAIDSTPAYDADLLVSGDWLVGFLADEAGEGLNLNDQADFTNRIAPISCDGSPDGDMLDDVLHWVEYSDFALGMPNALANSGLAGTDRVVVVAPHVGTSSSEADAGCDLNEDGDTADEVVRFVEAVFPPAPCIDPAEILALETSIAGGAKGLSSLDGRFIAVVDEADDGTDHDMNGVNQDLVAWLDPDAVNPTWQFSHQNPSIPSFGTGIFDSTGMSEPYAGSGWMSPEPIGDRLPLTFLEEVPGTNPLVAPLNDNFDDQNPICNEFEKDMDVVDALPVWADFESGPTLDFDGVGFAVDPANAGLVIARGFVFFRVHEGNDNVDWNSDGDKSDRILFRNPLTTCASYGMATASSIAGPVIVTDGDRGAAFYANEIDAAVDLNGDGDALDLVVRFFRF